MERDEAPDTPDIEIGCPACGAPVRVPAQRHQLAMEIRREEQGDDAPGRATLIVAGEVRHRCADGEYLPPDMDWQRLLHGEWTGDPPEWQPGTVRTGSVELRLSFGPSLGEFALRRVLWERLNSPSKEDREDARRELKAWEERHRDGRK